MDPLGAGRDDWTEALPALAAEICRSMGVPGCAPDIAQDAALDLLRTPPSNPGAKLAFLRKRIRTIAARYRKRQQRAPKELAEASVPVGRRPRNDQVGIPRLCPRLAAIGDGTGFERELSESLVVACDAVARLAEQVDDAQYRAFVLAYVCRRPMTEVARLLRCTPRAVTCRLQRLSRRLQRLIVDCLAEILAPDQRDEMTAALSRAQTGKKRRPVATARDTTICAILLDALDAVVRDDQRKCMSQGIDTDA